MKPMLAKSDSLRRHHSALGLIRVAQAGRKKVSDRCHQFACSLYYRFVFGRDVPLSSGLARKIASWEKQQGKGDIPQAKEAWDAEYSEGKWDFLRRSEQVARYSVIAGYLQFLKPGGRLLDVGCGSGILLERLNPVSYATYTGIDLSQAAIDEAIKKNHPRAAFVQADAQHYIPHDCFDAIVLNEVLYYLDKPLALIGRYESWLMAGGIFIASSFAKSERAGAINARLKERFKPIDEVKIQRQSKAWIISVFANC